MLRLLKMISTNQLILAADLGDLLKGLIPIIVVVLYGIQQFFGNMQEAKRKAAQKARPRPAPPQEFGAAPVAGRGAQPGAPQAAQPNLEETLRREVEEFLRRAQGQPAQQPKAQQPTLQPAKPAPPQSPPRRSPQQRPVSPVDRGGARQGRPAETAPPRRLSQEPQPQPMSPAREPQRPLGSGVGQLAAEHLRGSQDLVAHAQHLGADVAHADERMEQHLREKFAHQLGSLGPTISVHEAGRAAGSPSAAAELRALLARPGGVRQLILANEILRRPEERW